MDKAIVVCSTLHVAQEVGHRIRSDILKQRDIDIAEIGVKTGDRVARALTEKRLRTSGQRQTKKKRTQLYEIKAAADLGL